MGDLMDTGPTEVDRIARLLMAEWERVEGTPVNASYVATFADMARAVIADREENERDALFAVRRAWLDSGPEPAYHRMHQDNLRRNWPVLYDAIRKAVNHDSRTV